MRYWNRKTASVWLMLGVLTIACGSSDSDGGDQQQSEGGQGGEGGAAVAQGGAAGAQGGAAGAEGGQAGSSAGGYENCEKSCATASSLACPKDPKQEDCIAVCKGLFDVNPWCEDVYAKSVACMALQPASEWECGPGGNSQLKQNPCEQESRAATDCWFEGPSGGVPDITEDCRVSCQNLSGLTCAPKDCESVCRSVVEKGVGQEKACRGAIANYIHCTATKLTANDVRCDDKGNLQVTNDACRPALMMQSACVSAYCNGHPNDPACKKN